MNAETGPATAATSAAVPDASRPNARCRHPRHDHEPKDEPELLVKDVGLDHLLLQRMAMPLLVLRHLHDALGAVRDDLVVTGERLRRWKRSRETLQGHSGEQPLLHTTHEFLFFIRHYFIGHYR